MSWPIRPAITRKVRRVTACTSVATKTTATIVNSTVVSPLSWIGGMPRSMPSLTR